MSTRSAPPNDDDASVAQCPSSFDAPADIEQALRVHARVLWSVAAAVLGRRDEADDVVQESAIVALKKRDEFAGVERQLAWLTQIVRFVALNRRRANRSRYASSAEHLANLPAPPARRHDAVDDNGRIVSEHFDDRVSRALNRLPEVGRACFLLRVVNGLSYREIGCALDLSEGTAMSHVFRARQKMFEWLGGSPTPPSGSH